MDHPIENAANGSCDLKLESAQVFLALIVLCGVSNAKSVVQVWLAFQFDLPLVCYGMQGNGSIFRMQRNLLMSVACIVHEFELNTFGKNFNLYFEETMS
jgi:hypothetical protein